MPLRPRAAVTAVGFALALTLRGITGSAAWSRTVVAPLDFILALPALPVLALHEMFAENPVFALALVALLALAIARVYRIARQRLNFVANQRHWEAEARAAERELR